MFSECRHSDFPLIRYQGLDRPLTIDSKLLNKTTISDKPITIKTNRTWPNIMIQSVTVAQQPDPIDIDLGKTQPVPHFQIGLHQVQGFLRKLPKDGTNEIVFKFINAIGTPKYTRKQNGLMHSGRRCPTSPNSLKPTHTQVRVSTSKGSSEFGQPIVLKTNRTK